eukprot:210027-Pyramimonas_sp.AAC.1
MATALSTAEVVANLSSPDIEKAIKAANSLRQQIHTAANKDEVVKEYLRLSADCGDLLRLWEAMHSVTPLSADCIDLLRLLRSVLHPTAYIYFYVDISISSTLTPVIPTLMPCRPHRVADERAPA